MDIVERLIAGVGKDRVSVDPEDLVYYSTDIYSQGALPVAVVFPTDLASLRFAVRAATDAGKAVIPRGGGASYTGGIVPPTSESIVIDTSRLNQVVELSEDDMYVTVEAGCTWETLWHLLKQRGLRVPFWGPLSGAVATVGGTVSQGAVLWGSSRFGSSSESVLGLEVVTADGSVIATGMKAVRGGRPGWRQFGPDLTGIFLGDTGAFGIKATVTLRLTRAPNATGFASYRYRDRRALVAAMAELARTGTTVTGFALDPVLTDQRIRRGSLAQGAEAVRSMISGTANKLAAVRDAARIAAHGRRYVTDQDYTLHLFTDGRDQHSVDADMAEIRRICAAGTPIDDTVPRLLYSRPFGSLTSAIGPEGQRWAPLHVLVPLSSGNRVWERLDELRQHYQDRIEGLDIELGVMASTVSTTSMLLETVTTWPGPLGPYYQRNVDQSKLRRYPTYTRSPEAEALVDALRDDLITLFDEVGGAHFQIGRRYRYLDRLNPETRDLVLRIKQGLDPDNLMNPGVLGLPQTSWLNRGTEESNS